MGRLGRAVGTPDRAGPDTRAGARRADAGACAVRQAGAGRAEISAVGGAIAGRARGSTGPGGAAGPRGHPDRTRGAGPVAIRLARTGLPAASGAASGDGP